MDDHKDPQSASLFTFIEKFMDEHHAALIACPRSRVTAIILRNPSKPDPTAGVRFGYELILKAHDRISAGHDASFDSDPSAGSVPLRFVLVAAFPYAAERQGTDIGDYRTFDAYGSEQTICDRIDIYGGVVADW